MIALDIKKKAFDSVESKIKKKKKQTKIFNWSFVIIQVGTTSLWVITCFNPIKSKFLMIDSFLSFSLMILGYIIWYLISKKIKNMKKINESADRTIKPIMREIIDQTIASVCKRAFNKEEITTPLKELLYDKIENYYIVWFTKKCNLKTNWHYIIKENSLPIIIDGENYFFQSLKVLDEKETFIGNKLLVKVKLLLLNDIGNPMILKHIEWIIPINIE